MFKRCSVKRVKEKSFQPDVIEHELESHRNEVKALFDLGHRWNRKEDDGDQSWK